MLIAVKRNNFGINHASKRLLGNKDFMLPTILHDYYIIYRAITRTFSK